MDVTYHSIRASLSGSNRRLKDIYATLNISVSLKYLPLQPVAPKLSKAPANASLKGSVHSAHQSPFKSALAVKEQIIKNYYLLK